MAATLQQLRAERRKYFSSLLAVMKRLDGAQEATQRKIRQCLSRKKGYIDLPDLQALQKQFALQVTYTNEFGTLLGKGFIA